MIVRGAVVQGLGTGWRREYLVWLAGGSPRGPRMSTELWTTQPDFYEKLGFVQREQPTSDSVRLVHLYMQIPVSVSSPWHDELAGDEDLFELEICV